MGFDNKYYEYNEELRSSELPWLNYLIKTFQSRDMFKDNISFEWEEFNNVISWEDERWFLDLIKFYELKKENWEIQKENFLEIEKISLNFREILLIKKNEEDFEFFDILVETFIEDLDEMVEKISEFKNEIENWDDLIIDTDLVDSSYKDLNWNYIKPKIQENTTITGKNIVEILKIEEVTDDMKNLLDENNGLSERNNFLEPYAKDFSKVASKLEESVEFSNNLLSEINKLKLEKEWLIKKYNEDLWKIEDEINSVKKISNDLINVNNNIEFEKSELKKKYEEEIEKLKKELENIKNDKNISDKEKNNKIYELKSNISSLKNEIKENNLTIEKNNFIFISFQNKINNLEFELKDKKNKIERLLEENNYLKEENNYLKQEKNDLKIYNNDLKEGNLQIDNENFFIKEELDWINSMIKNIAEDKKKKELELKRDVEKVQSLKEKMKKILKK